MWIWVVDVKQMCVAIWRVRYYAYPRSAQQHRRRRHVDRHQDDLLLQGQQLLEVWQPGARQRWVSLFYLFAQCTKDSMNTFYLLSLTHDSRAQMQNWLWSWSWQEMHLSVHIPGHQVPRMHDAWRWWRQIVVLHGSGRRGQIHQWQMGLLWTWLCPN